ncbi:ABC transporter ATP-binding protein [Bifidobacterium eulemuris]|uniref:Taurine ABC transporter, ATP-binding protein n=2 Tax=Bifidobacterium eulemuris TaxID=1765219 RepID=A0A261GDX5_9BIFI|nr:ABC transporter ATP-binding protein [Bifidobacterium eulemuris]OZG69659.1 taurine ABC transporter, ATP-binding protein [Bifidobacterium eulemuris]
MAKHDMTWDEQVEKQSMDARGVAVDIRGVNKRFTTLEGNEVTALHDINLTINKHDFICVVGRSGCGKTTLLNMLSGFEKPSDGEVVADGRVIDGPSPRRGVVFQKPPLYPWLTVRGNVEFGMRMQGVASRERKEIAERYLEMVGLKDAGDRRPYELSGGMQQRAQIARVLACDPDLILMDEPYGALDALTRERLQNELLRIWFEKRKTVFFITHSVDEAIFLATRVIVMSAHPGTVKMDIPISIPRDPADPDNMDKVRADPRFAELRDMITAAIYEQDDQDE